MHPCRQAQLKIPPLQALITVESSYLSYLPAQPRGPPSHHPTLWNSGFKGANSKQCGSKLGDLISELIKIGKTYYAPNIEPCGLVSVHSEGEVRPGEENTLVDGWSVSRS